MERNCMTHDLPLEMKGLNTKTRYKRSGTLGTSESFVNQPPSHAELYKIFMK